MAENYSEMMKGLFQIKGAAFFTLKSLFQDRFRGQLRFQEFPVCFLES